MSATKGIGPNTVVRRSEEPVAVDVDGSVVMLSIQQGMYYGLEGVGPRIWALLDEPRSVNDMCQALMQEFDIDEASCRREVMSFLDELRNAQLILIQGEADGTTPSPDRS